MQGNGNTEKFRDSKRPKKFKDNSKQKQPKRGHHEHTKKDMLS